MSNHNEKNELNSGKLLTSSVEDNPEPSQICLICKRELENILTYMKGATTILKRSTS